MESNQSTPSNPIAQMGQSDVEPQGNPELQYDLKRGQKGWNGKGEFFRVLDNVIRIKHTDANFQNTPSAEERIRTVDDEGNFSQYSLIEIGSPLHRLWMDKIGPYLGDWVLRKNPQTSPPWKLLKFPDGYTLWLHKTGVQTDPANPRTDAYLYGAPHLGPRTRSRSQNTITVFRSPMEFVEHAIWLMKGCEGRCLCKYCTPGQSQRDINARLNHGLRTESDSDDSDGGGGTGPQSSRRRGAGSQGRRPRHTKRDRSPPIMAKDYRVGNSGPGAA
ncbi:hypothetical protein F5148DRAFT_186266 [Russula earlei]|uniref:Uncharacterized protein n=1 Tax=Russula earlei TaxID=71964 RepID=A0ACC0U5F3_9AGAM|nr:hypothetical protein F5148DRAFT_186266 [Russula earlei]